MATLKATQGRIAMSTDPRPRINQGPLCVAGGLLLVVPGGVTFFDSTVGARQERERVFNFIVADNGKT
jgi:UPF0716 family protein affecting phage T7 exclusion